MNVIKPKLSDLLDYDCMFFDFDGVVLESGDIKTEAFIELFAGQGISDGVKKHHLENQGISRYDKFKWITENLLNEVYTPERKQFLGQKFAELVREKVMTAPFVPGFPEMIRSIREHDIYCVVASGTPDQELNQIIENRSLTPWFDEVHGSPRKKDEIVKEVWSKRKFNPEKCLFFGDASTDFEAAKEVGIDFFARLTPELSAYWSNVRYEFGMEDFKQIS